MNGYFEQNLKTENNQNKGILNISVTNINEFKDLIEKATKEAHQLNETIDRLNTFHLQVEFLTKDSI
ncbi:hypothetical protein [uncultured Eubacterium sp.]|uniref:hypothetical protein n=1 Tax=uncultured Eubacterium sp. TaxID=165185 RepID=UPI002672E0E4|nr:hypothetical protein [uncultured Eubacterium sp.]